MTLPKGGVQQGPEKGGIHVGTADNTSNKKIDEERRIANDFIEHQRQHHQDATPSDIEEIPTLAVQPEPMPPCDSWCFPAQRGFRYIHAGPLLCTRLALLLSSPYSAAQVSKGKHCC